MKLYSASTITYLVILQALLSITFQFQIKANIRHKLKIIDESIESVNNEKCYTKENYLIIPDPIFAMHFKRDLIQKQDFPLFLKGKLRLKIDNIEFNAFENTSLLILNFPGDYEPSVYTFMKAMVLRNPINRRTTSTQTDLEILLFFKKTDNSKNEYESNRYATFSVQVKAYDFTKEEGFKSKTCLDYNYDNEKYCNILSSEVKRLLNKRLFDNQFYSFGSFFKASRNPGTMKKDYGLNIQAIFKYLKSEVIAYDMDSIDIDSNCKAIKEDSEKGVKFNNNMLVFNKPVEISICLYNQIIKQFDDNRIEVLTAERNGEEGLLRSFKNEFYKRFDVSEESLKKKNFKELNDFSSFLKNQTIVNPGFIKDYLFKRKLEETQESLKEAKSTTIEDDSEFLDITMEEAETEAEIRKKIFVVNPKKVIQNFIEKESGDDEARISPDITEKIKDFEKLNSFKNYKNHILKSRNFRSVLVNHNVFQDDNYVKVQENSKALKMEIPFSKHNGVDHSFHNLRIGMENSYNPDKQISDLVKILIEDHKAKNKKREEQLNEKCKLDVYTSINKYTEEKLLEEKKIPLVKHVEVKKYSFQNKKPKVQSVKSTIAELEAEENTEDGQVRIKNIETSIDEKKPETETNKISISTKEKVKDTSKLKKKDEDEEDDLDEDRNKEEVAKVVASFKPDKSSKETNDTKETKEIKPNTLQTHQPYQNQPIVHVSSSSNKPVVETYHKDNEVTKSQLPTLSDSPHTLSQSSISSESLKTKNEHKLIKNEDNDEDEDEKIKKRKSSLEQFSEKYMKVISKLQKISNSTLRAETYIKNSTALVYDKLKKVARSVNSTSNIGQRIFKLENSSKNRFSKYANYSFRREAYNIDDFGALFRKNDPDSDSDFDPEEKDIMLKAASGGGEDYNYKSQYKDIYNSKAKLKASQEGQDDSKGKTSQSPTLGDTEVDSNPPFTSSSPQKEKTKVAPFLKKERIVIINGTIYLTQSFIIGTRNETKETILNNYNKYFNAGH